MFRQVYHFSHRNFPFKFSYQSIKKADAILTAETCLHVLGLQRDYLFFINFGAIQFPKLCCKSPKRSSEMISTHKVLFIIFIKSFIYTYQSVEAKFMFLMFGGQPFIMHLISFASVLIHFSII